MARAGKSSAQAGFASEVKRARQERGWSQQALADKIGVTQSTIDRIERGGVRTRFAPEIAAVLGIGIPVEVQADTPPNSSIKSLRACALAYIREYGRRNGPLDALRPADEQDAVVAAAMRLLEAIDGGQ